MTNRSPEKPKHPDKPQTDAALHPDGGKRGRLQAAPSVETPPITSMVLKRLLDKLGISIQAGALVHAFAAVEQMIPFSTPVEQAHQILKHLQIRGVQSAQLRWLRFDQRRLPALVFFEGGWWLVERGENDKLLLTDAGGGDREADETDLSESVVLWLGRPRSGADIPDSGMGENPAARMVWRELFKNRRWVLEVFIATVIINLLAVATSIFALQVYDRVVPTLAYATLWTLVAGMFLVIGIDWLLKNLRARILDSVACAADKSISQQVFDHIMRLRLDTAPRSLGTLAAQVNGLDAARQFFSSGVIFMLVDMPFALMFIAFIAVIGGSVAWVYLLMLPFALILGFVAQQRLRLLMKRQLMRSNERQGLLVDSIRGAESIRANNASWRFSEEWKTITDSITGYSIQQKAINNTAMVTTGALSSLAYICAIVVGVGRIESGLLTMGGLIACSILGGRVIAPIARAAQYISQWQAVSQALQMVNQVLIRKTERRPDQTLLMPERAPERLELEGVRFSYPDSPIRQLNIPHLKLSAGDRVMLLGPVGSGKSTLLKILAGLYRPSEGRVRLGDADLWETDPQVVANHVGYLPQNVHLFKGSLRSNLSLSGSVSDSLLLRTCAELGIDRIADDSPQGMDLDISEGGEGLSGGQRQLVAMARVLLAQPRIWLLDEPGASLDAETETRLLDTIKTHLQPKDILVFATHRPMVARPLANRIMVMRQGEMLMDGEPEQVIPALMRQRQQQSGVGYNPAAGHAPTGVTVSPGSGGKGPLNVI